MGSKISYISSSRISVKELIEMKKKNKEATAPFINHPYAVKKEKKELS